MLRGIWDELSAIDSSNYLAANSAGKRLLASGADASDVLSVATLIAYETVFALLLKLSEGTLVDLTTSPQGLPGVVLMETDSNRVPTGRTLDCMHESLLSADPSGNSGADFLN